MDMPQLSTPENPLSDAKNGDNFIIDDLLDIPNDDNILPLDDSNTTPAPCNSTFSPHYQHLDAPHANNFTTEFCVPYDDVEELEWLSNFVEEESFSSDDLQQMHLIQGMKARTSDASDIHHYQFQPQSTRSGPVFSPEMTVPAKARTKRPRPAPGKWTSNLLVISPTPPTNASTVSSASESDITIAKKSLKPGPTKKKEGPENSSGGDPRKCLHCATDKTPQWRTGPLGPKTLCNACGVRYKSGRLVPEYRPASSPTFVLTKHSNSHRKVLELRRQKEMQRAQQQQHQFLHHHQHQNMMFGHVPSNPDDYLIHQHIGPDYRQLI